MINGADWAKQVLAANEAVQYGIFGVIAGSGYFPPCAFLNEFLMAGGDPCDQDGRMGSWMPFELSPAEYRAVLSWWSERHPGVVEDRLGAERWSEWVQKLLDS